MMGGGAVGGYQHGEGGFSPAAGPQRNGQRWLRGGFGTGGLGRPPAGKYVAGPQRRGIERGSLGGAGERLHGCSRELDHRPGDSGALRGDLDYPLIQLKVGHDRDCSGDRWAPKRLVRGARLLWAGMDAAPRALHPRDVAERRLNPSSLLHGPLRRPGGAAGIQALAVLERAAHAGLGARWPWARRCHLWPRSGSTCP